MPESRQVPLYRNEAVAVVFRVRPDRPGPGGLEVLAWRRERAPYDGHWALPSGPLLADETIGECVARHLAVRVDLTRIAHLEQLETRSDPGRDPAQRTVATAYLGLVPMTAATALPSHADWLPVGDLPRMAFDHASLVRSGHERLRAKISYTNLGFALAPETFTMATLSAVYGAVLGYRPSTTNLQRVLTRRGQLVRAGTTSPGSGKGGRPAHLYRFTERVATVTDPFAVLRPRQ
ncbi:NUDIX hydrolase [Cumulibacter manganitolerans]|uniref:NUDIX hydrolase n=1 Tax=Cumulibacter manganitolerans TaxID=1884992 RepID=UPI0012956B99|nr:NUDIX domain-containing protein [Cumulibacter manganitolerans]